MSVYNCRSPTLNVLSASTNSLGKSEIAESGKSIPLWRAALIPATAFGEPIFGTVTVVVVIVVVGVRGVGGGDSARNMCPSLVVHRRRHRGQLTTELSDFSQACCHLEQALMICGPLLRGDHLVQLKRINQRMQRSRHVICRSRLLQQ